MMENAARLLAALVVEDRIDMTYANVHVNHVAFPVIVDFLEF